LLFFYLDIGSERRAAIYLRRPRSGAWSRRAFLKKPFPDFFSSDQFDLQIKTASMQF
jgi:hypothetical protein